MKKLFILLCLVSTSIFALEDVSVKKISIYPTQETDYSKMDFLNNRGEVLGELACHELSNPKPKLIDGVMRLVRYKHNHCSRYTTNGLGEKLGILDYTFGHTKPQIQIENADLIMKGRDSFLIMRAENGSYFKLVVGSDGALSTVRVDSSYIQLANDGYVIVGEVND